MVLQGTMAELQLLCYAAEWHSANLAQNNTCPLASSGFKVHNPEEQRNKRDSARIGVKQGSQKKITIKSFKKNLPKLYSSLLMTVTVISAYFNRCSVYKTANGFRGYE